MSRRIVVGDKIVCSRRFSDIDVRHFSELTGDFNPIHLDDDYAKASIFGKRILHGMMVASVFSGLLAQELPGPGSIYLAQTLTFSHPMFLDEDLRFSVVVTKIREDKPIITLNTVCTNADSVVTLHGEAVIKLDSSQRH